MTRCLFMHDRNTFPVRALARVLAALMLMAAVSAQAKTPQEIFEIAAPSIVVVEVLDVRGKLEATGSGVVVSPGEVITNCHVAKADKTLRVKHGKSRHAARLRHTDRERDLCQLSVPGLAAAPAKLGEVKNLKAGARVVAIGAPQGLELTISEGLVSALRDFGGGAKIIQTTAPISPGSSGGGLFDEAGRLIGITTFYLAEGQNLNFALPVEWIADLPDRAAISAKDKTNSLDWLARTLVLQKRKDWPALLTHSQRWTQAEQGNSTAWFSLGVSYAHLGQHTQAIVAYRVALRNDPNNAVGWNGLGASYARLGQHTQAIEAHREALRNDPSYADGWHGLGFSYSDLGQHTQAIEAYREALRNGPNNSLVWNDLGVSYSALGQDTQAIDAYREALRNDPKHALVWYNLGLAHARQGNRSGAIEAYQILRDLDPAMADRLFNRAIAPR